MSIETAIANLTVAVQENTAALKAAGGGKAASSPAPTPAKGPAADKKAPASAHSRAEMNAALQEVKEKKGAPAAKEIITATGGAAKMAEITDDKIDAVYDAAKKAVEESGDDM